MVSAPHLIAFSATAFIVIVIPGPSVLFAISRALGSGRRVAAFSVIGNALGVYLQAIAIAFGVGALAAQSVAAFTVLKLLGGCYLIYLGIRTFRARRMQAAEIAVDRSARSGRRSIVEGFIVGATNPKTVVFLAAVLPQFVDRAAGGGDLQIVILGTLFAVIAVISDMVWVIAAGALRDWFRGSPRRLEFIGGLGGLAIVGLGGAILLTGRRN